MGLTLHLNASTEVVLMENNVELAIVRRLHPESPNHIEAKSVHPDVRVTRTHDGSFEILRAGMRAMMVTRVPRRKSKVNFEGVPYIEIFRRTRTTE